MKCHSRVVEKRAARRGQLDAMHAAVQKLDADFVFEIPDLPAERRLRGVQFLLGGDSQASGLGDGDEVAEMP